MCQWCGKHSLGITLADPGVGSLIRVRPHTVMEIDHEIFSTVILLPLIEEGLLSVTSESMCPEYWLTAYSKLPQEMGLTDHLDMTIDVDWNVEMQTKLFMVLITSQIVYSS